MLKSSSKKCIVTLSLLMWRVGKLGFILRASLVNLFIRAIYGILGVISLIMYFVLIFFVEVFNYIIILTKSKKIFLGAFKTVWSFNLVVFIVTYYFTILFMVTLFVATPYCVDIVFWMVCLGVYMVYLLALWVVSTFFIQMVKFKFNYFKSTGYSSFILKIGGFWGTVVITTCSVFFVVVFCMVGIILFIYVVNLLLFLLHFYGWSFNLTAWFLNSNFRILCTVIIVLTSKFIYRSWSFKGFGIKKSGIRLGFLWIFWFIPMQIEGCDQAIGLIYLFDFAMNITFLFEGLIDGDTFTINDNFHQAAVGNFILDPNNLNINVINPIDPTLQCYNNWKPRIQLLYQDLYHYFVSSRRVFDSNSPIYMPQIFTSVPECTGRWEAIGHRGFTDLDYPHIPRENVIINQADQQLLGEVLVAAGEDSEDDLLVLVGQTLGLGGDHLVRWSDVFTFLNWTWYDLLKALSNIFDARQLTIQNIGVDFQRDRILPRVHLLPGANQLPRLPGAFGEVGPGPNILANPFVHPRFPVPGGGFQANARALSTDTLDIIGRIVLQFFLQHRARGFAGARPIVETGARLSTRFRSTIPPVLVLRNHFHSLQDTFRNILRNIRVPFRRGESTPTSSSSANNPQPPAPQGGPGSSS